MPEGYPLRKIRELVRAVLVTLATGKAGREASGALLAQKVKETGKPATVGKDKAYDCAPHGEGLRGLGATPHVAHNNGLTKTGKTRTTIIDDETAASAGYGMSQTRRRMIACIFGRGKQHGTLRKTRHRGLTAVAGDFLPNMIADNLIRIPKLAPAQEESVQKTENHAQTDKTEAKSSLQTHLPQSHSFTKHTTPLQCWGGQQTARMNEKGAAGFSPSLHPLQTSPPNFSRQR